MTSRNIIDMSPFSNCIQDPQTALANSLQGKNIQVFKMALEMDADPTRMDPVTNITIFEKALQTYGCAEFVKECIKRGCKCDYTNRLLNKQPINFATESKDPAILSIILNISGVPVDAKFSNLTPINSLAKNITSENYRNVFECMKILIEHNANLNIPDQTERTPVLYIAKSKKIDNEQKREILQYFFKHADCDLDSFRDGEAREILSKEFPDLTLPFQTNGRVDFEILLKLLKNSNEQQFLQAFESYQSDLPERDNQQNANQEKNSILLLEAIKKGLQNAVIALIKSGVNINHIESNNSAIEVACVYGNWQALETLLEQHDLKFRQYENLLITVIKKLEEPTYNTFCDYYRCFYLLLNSDKINVNEADESGTTALHYAVKYKHEKAVRELLNRGAYIGANSQFNEIPIEDINPDLLEDFFDSCITTNGQKPGENNFEIIINYSNLIPPQKKKQKINQVKEEMLPIEYIAKSKDLLHLLKHPLITSFMFLKWHRLLLFFYINLFLYCLFWGSLVSYIILNFNRSTDEAVLYTLKAISIVVLLYMFVRECLQFLISPQIFLCSFVNYLEIGLIILSVICLSGPNYDKEAQRVMAVLTILLASIELCLLVGSLPILSISTHMLMLQEVSTSFIKSFALYSIFVITFSLCFYVLFGRVETPGSEEEGDFNKFENPFTAIIKTVVMLTGEFDAGDINFKSSPMSYFVFLLFVFFMTIILFNLLNGLAVSDTQVIKAQAELNGYICRTKLLASYERVLTGKNSVSGFFINHEPFLSMSKNLINLFPHHITGKYIAITPNNQNKILVPVSNSRNEEMTLLKSNGRAFRQFEEEIDQEKQILKGPIQNLPCCCVCLLGKCSEMDKRTVKTALLILDKNKRIAYQKQKEIDHEMRLKNVEDKIDLILNILQNRN